MVIFDVGDIDTRPKGGWPKIFLNGVDVTYRVISIDTEMRLIKWYTLDEKGKHTRKIEEILIPESVKIEVKDAN